MNEYSQDKAPATGQDGARPVVAGISGPGKNRTLEANLGRYRDDPGYLIALIAPKDALPAGGEA